MSGSGLFVLILVLTNGIFGTITAAYLLGKNHRFQLPAWPLVFTGLGLGPFLLTVSLYYLLLLWHGLPPVVLVGAQLLLFGILAFYAGDGWQRLVAMIKGIPRLLRDPSIWFFMLGSAFLLLVTLAFLGNKPMVDHDVLEYGIQGRIFLRDAAITYQEHRFDASTGFYYVGLHGFSFPLLGTWEGLLGSLCGVQSDLWLRSINMWYGWLLIALVWAVLRRFDRWVAVAGGIALTAPMGFLFLVTVYHLDSYRIFFFSAAIAAFVVLFQRPTVDRLLLFAVLAAAVTFIHSIGAILVGGLWLVGLLLLPFPWGTRIKWSLGSLGVILALGGVHYVLDIVFGTGWILQDLIWF